MVNTNEIPSIKRKLFHNCPLFVQLFHPSPRHREKQCSRNVSRCDLVGVFFTCVLFLRRTSVSLRKHIVISAQSVSKYIYIYYVTHFTLAITCPFLLCKMPCMGLLHTSSNLQTKIITCILRLQIQVHHGELSECLGHPERHSQCVLHVWIYIPS